MNISQRPKNEYEFVNKNAYFFNLKTNKKTVINCVKSTEFDPKSKIFYSSHDRNIIDLITQ